MRHKPSYIRYRIHEGMLWDRNWIDDKNWGIRACTLQRMNPEENTQILFGGIVLGYGH